MQATTENSGVQARHQAQLDQGRFLIQRCSDCSRHVYFPREACPHCGSAALGFVEPSGAGTVYATTIVRRKSDAGGDLNVALIDLDEGVRLMSRVENLPPPEVRIGMRVQARVLVKDGSGMVVFDAAEAVNAAGAGNAAGDIRSEGSQP